MLKRIPGPYNRTPRPSDDGRVLINVVVNGAFSVNQDANSATLVNNTAKYIADCWEAMYNHGAATATITSVQSTNVIAGFPYGQQITATAALTSPANGDFIKYRTKIEGYRVANWGWGAAGALDIVVAFRLFSVVGGVALVRLSNSAGNRFYYHEITVAAGHNFYSFPVPGDTSGTWLITTGIGLNFEVFTCGKETTPGTSFDVWGATAKIQTTNSTNLLGANNNYTVLTGVYIAAGKQLPVEADLPRLMRTFDEELIRSKRYYRQSYSYGVAPFTITQTGRIAYVAAGTGGEALPAYSYTPTMRAAPTTVFYSPDTGASAAIRNATGAADVAATPVTVTADGHASGSAGHTTGNVYWYHYTANARL